MHLPTVLSRLSVLSTSLTQPALPLIHKAKKPLASITLTTLATLCFSFSSSAVANPGTLSDFPTRSTYSAGTTSSFSGYAADGGSDVIYLNVTMPATLSTGKTMLFESGGGLYGITVYYEGNSFKVSLGEGNVVDLIASDTFVAGQRYTLFIEINRSPNTVVAYVAPQTDTDLPGQVSSIGSSSWTGPNWSGSNGAGWGVKNSAIQGVAGSSNEVNSFANFDGSFHEGRFYSQKTFAEVWEDGETPVDNQGDSAYQVAVNNGFVGTEVEWLASLKGDAGIDGVDGIDGLDGLDGADGASAYQIAQANGFTGSQSDWLASLRGAQGAQGPQGIQGPQGVQGIAGADGEDGAGGQDGDSFFTQTGNNVALQGPNNLQVTGGDIETTGNIKVDNSNTACDSTYMGAIRYNTRTQLLEFCNGSDWNNIDSQATVATNWRFAEVDYSSARNDFDGFDNTSSYPNSGAFATLASDGSVEVWGDMFSGGTVDVRQNDAIRGAVGAPTDSGYTKIYSTNSGFAALKADGTITAWGPWWLNLENTPTDSGYTHITSTSRAYAAIKADGSITAWGASGYGNTGEPTDNGYTNVYSNTRAFAALKADGSIVAWGGSGYGGAGQPLDNGYVKISSTSTAFAALKADGSITAWGNSSSGGTGAPTDNGYTQIYSTFRAFAALKADGSITVWGDQDYGGANAPNDNDYTKIYTNSYAFAALKADGSISTWGDSDKGGVGAPNDSGYVKIYSDINSFAALKSDGSITAWGTGASGYPTDNGYTAVYTTSGAYAALKADGSITAWGDSNQGGVGAPTDSGYIQIYSTGRAFAAVKTDGTLSTWGDSNSGGDGPSD